MVDFLRDYCVLALKLEKMRLSGIWRYNVPELKRISEEMNLPISTKRAEMLTNIGEVIVNPDYKLDEITILQELYEEQAETNNISNINETASEG